MTKNVKSGDDGFALIELLTVTIVIAILAALAIPVFYGQRGKASNASAISDLRNVATIEQAHFIDADSYATDLAVLGAEGLRRSPGIKLGVAVSDSGFCEVAVAGSTFWWYDSGAGGLQAASTRSLTPPSSATGVCATAHPAQVS